jgi:integral membrane protein
MKGLTTAYRAMAYITGVLIIVLIFAGIPLQVWAHNTVISDYVGIAHGYLYIVYVIVAFWLSQRLKMPVLSLRVLILLLAGLLPVVTFVVERWMMRAYIAPALAGETPGKSAPQQSVSR